MDINNLTIGQAKELVGMFENNSTQKCLGSQFIGKKVIIRTYSAGVWFGVLSEKLGSEVILTSARRMWRWQAAESISLSAVANFGIDRARSKICAAVDSVWLDAIEIISLTDVAIDSIEDASDVEAE